MTLRLSALPSVGALCFLGLAAFSQLLVGCGGANVGAYPTSPAHQARRGPAERTRVHKDKAAEFTESTASAPKPVDSDGDTDSDGVLDVNDRAPMKETAVMSPAGFGGQSTPASPPSPPVPQAAQPSEGMRSDKPAPTVEPAQNRDFVIYTARFTMAVYQVDQGLAAVEKIAKDNGGYLSLKKDREITVRIPRGRFEITLAAVDRIGDVLHRDIQAEDVTDEHVDLEIRIKNARSMQKRLVELLSKASVKDALEIEKELHRITEELERLEGRMKVLKDKVAFSTITVLFQPRGATLVAHRARLPFPWLGQLNLATLLSLSEDK